MKSKTKVLLTITCRNMKSPKYQRSRFDQALGENSWMLQMNKNSKVHDDGTVTTTSVWGRAFGERKSKDDILRLTQNLLKRAAEEAEIETYDCDFEFEIVMGNKEPFGTSSVLTQDD